MSGRQNILAIQELANKYRVLLPLMDERMRRQWAAVEAEHYGWGGISAVAQATGLSMNTIRRGIGEVRRQAAQPEEPIAQQLRQKGGGRKRKTLSDPQLAEALAHLIEPATRGDPESPLRWLSKSTRHLAAELTVQGHPVSERTVGRLLHAAGYSLQSNQKRLFTITTCASLFYPQLIPISPTESNLDAKVTVTGPAARSVRRMLDQ